MPRRERSTKRAIRNVETGDLISCTYSQGGPRPGKQTVNQAVGIFIRVSYDGSFAILTHDLIVRWRCWTDVHDFNVLSRIRDAVG